MKLKTKTARLTFTALFVAINAIMSQISLPVPISAVPFSLGIAAALLTGALLPPACAVTAEAVYVALGAVGLPVFSQFRGGFYVIIGPTGGFLLGYILAAFAVSHMISRLPKLTFARIFAIMVVGVLICYAVGTPWFMLVTRSGFYAALTACVLTFVIPDILKAAVGAYLTLVIRKKIKQ